MTWYFPDRTIKVKSQKSYEDNYVLSSPNVRAICMYSTDIVFEETFAQTDFVVVSCAVRGLNECYSPVVSNWQTRVCDIPSAHLQASKLAIDKTYAQSRSLFLQLWPALFKGWVCFTPLLFRSDNAGCTLFQARAFWARLLVFKATFVETVFAVVNCAVVGLSVFYSLVLTRSLMFLQLWLLGHSDECICIKLERW